MNYYHLSMEEILKTPTRRFFSMLKDLYNTKFNEVVRIRTTNEPKRVKSLSDGEKEIRNKWLEYCREKEKFYIKAMPQEEEVSRERVLAQSREILSIFKGLANQK